MRKIISIISLLIIGAVLFSGCSKLNNTKKSISESVSEKESVVKEKIDTNDILFFKYQDLRKKCNKGSYGCFYFIALLEADNVLYTTNNTCPENYFSISNKEIGYDHEIKELSGLIYCKEDIKNKLTAISKQKVEKLKNKMLGNSLAKCFDIKLVEIDETDSIFYSYKDGKLSGLSLKNFKDDYTPMKLEWQIRCADMPSKEDRILFYSKTKNKYYLIEENNLEFFLKNEKKFLINKYFAFLGEEEHNIFFDEEIIDTDYRRQTRAREKNEIIKTVMNSNYQITGLKELNPSKPIYEKVYKYCVPMELYPSEDYEYGFFDKKPKVCGEYKMKNPYRGNLFLSYEEEITKEAKNVCSGENNGKVQKSNIKVFLLEISDNFEILNKEEIHYEKGVKRKIYCHHFG